MYTSKLNFNKKIILIEDNKYSRSVLLGDFDAAVKMGIIVSPTNYSELEKYIEFAPFYSAISDFNLGEWHHSIDSKKSKYEIDNGINVLEEIQKKDTKTSLHVYSANSGDLSEELKRFKSKEINQIFGLDQTVEKIKEKLQEVINIKMQISQMHPQTTDSYPLYVFLATKIFNFCGINDIWKAGQNIWIVASNENTEYILQDTEIANKRLEIEVRRDAETIKIKHINIKDRFLIDSDEIREKISSGQFELAEKEDYLYEYIVLKFATELYLEEEIEFSNYVNFLNKLSPHSKLESQKLLFINELNNSKKEFQEQELKIKIENNLSIFTSVGFDKINDIYVGKVINIDDDLAYITLKNFAFPDQIKSIKTPSQQLVNLLLEEESEFLYTVYYNNQTSSLCTQIIPL